VSPRWMMQDFGLFTSRAKRMFIACRITPAIG
jgi:hypothetical protein